MDFAEWKAHQARATAEGLLPGLAESEKSLDSLTPQALADGQAERVRQAASQMLTQAAVLLRAIEAAEKAGVPAEDVKPLREMHDAAQVRVKQRLVELEQPVA
jgi:crotonobetainyl-CoA:carnitine CoA-transferase CaiB-like acyl-CoA transferase